MMFSRVIAIFIILFMATFGEANAIFARQVNAQCPCPAGNHLLCCNSLLPATNVQVQTVAALLGIPAACQVPLVGINCFPIANAADW
ncbi:hypothetical protein MD484_g8414, partial [Candolleomyces efflorescens]